MAIETTQDSTQQVANSQTSTNLNTDYNNKAVEQINTQYDKNIESNKINLEKAYNENTAALDRSQEKLAGQYQGQKNELATQYERNRRNQNMQAATSGLNTGANTQMNLAQSNAYLAAYNKLGQSEAEANKDIESQRMTLMQSYQSDIAKAAADGDAQRAAALLDEYNTQRTNTMNQANQLAQYGDFSLYATLYGQEQAQIMQRGWAMQNPDVAWSLGYLTAAEYKALTGTDPNMMSGNMDENGYFIGQNSINSNNTGAGSGGGYYGGYPDTLGKDSRGNALTWDPSLGNWTQKVTTVNSNTGTSTSKTYNVYADGSYSEQ